MRSGMARVRGHAGTTVVELLVAVVLLGLIVVALGASSLYASRLVVRSSGELGSAEFVQREMERLWNVPYDSLADGDVTYREGTSTWTVEDSSNYRRILLVTHYAPTPKISVWDTVTAYRMRSE